MKVTAMNLQDNARNLSGDKELTGAYSVVVSRKGEPLRELISLRTWMGRSRSASVVYATIWINASYDYGAGHGRAGGYGYHKASAAAGEAITSAGITLDQKIDGAGNVAIREALGAIARKLGYRTFLIVEHH